MATKLAYKFIDADSPFVITEAFCDAMSERVFAIVEGIKKQRSTNILFAEETKSYEGKMDSAINYVIEDVNQNGVENITESIDKGATLYGVKSEDLKSILENAINDDEIVENMVFETFETNFLSSLDTILENREGKIVMFKNTSSAYITPQESESLLEVYSQLNTENKKKLVETACNSRKDYNNVVQFAESYNITENDDHMHQSLKQHGWEYEHHPSAGIMGKKYIHTKLPGHEIYTSESGKYIHNKGNKQLGNGSGHTKLNMHLDLVNNHYKAKGM